MTIMGRAKTARPIIVMILIHEFHFTSLCVVVLSPHTTLMM